MKTAHLMIGLGAALAALMIYLIISHPIAFTKISPITTSSCGPTDNCITVVGAVVSRGCAPWDGPAIDTYFTYEGRKIGIQIYAKGLEQFSAGQMVTINRGTDSANGTGNAHSCDLDGKNCSAYPANTVEISLPKDIVGVEGLMKGSVVIQGAVIPINATWSDVRSMCG